jgi:prepilin-type N-terminal cleavage/methylation domain-containing protein
VRGQSGYSLVELMAAMAIMLLMVGVASIGGIHWVESVRLSRVSSELVDYVVLARERAIGGYQQWRITFDASSPQAAQGYVIDYCQLTTGQKLGEPCAGTWTRYKDPRRPSDVIHTQQGVGVTLRETASGLPVSAITFDRSGYFLNPTVDITICRVLVDPAGPRCRNEASPKVRIQSLVGSIEVCPTGACSAP